MSSDRKIYGVHGMPFHPASVLRYAVSALACLILFAASPSGAVADEADSGKRPTQSLEERWGIEVLGISLSAAGYMVDFRYRVIDAERAGPLFDRAVKPYLMDIASGAKFMVPSPAKVGPLRTTNKPQAGKNYFIIFANPGKHIRQGNEVTVVVGDFRSEKLVVK